MLIVTMGQRFLSPARPIAEDQHWYLYTVIFAEAVRWTRWERDIQHRPEAA
jgi:hypothetical protein